VEAATRLTRTDQQEEPGSQDGLPDRAARSRAAIELVRNHRTLLLASARRVSLCPDDAEDAMQRGLEILLTKAPTTDPRHLLPWARTVVRNEALAIRKARERTMGRPGGAAADSGLDGGEPDWVEAIPSAGRATEDEVESRERVARSREALALLKPQELKALTQLASGMSYAEIQAANGWTRTKVNRCLAEGREKLRSVVRLSEAGERCRLIEPLVSAAADGELEPEAAETVRNHLAVCGRCRVTLREYRRIPAAVAAAGPLALSVADPLASESGQPGLIARLLDRVDELSIQAWFRLNGLFGGGESASAAALGSGGARGLGSTALAKFAAICVGTAGGAAACLGTGLVPVPGEPEVDPEPTAIERPAPSATTPEASSSPVGTPSGDGGAGGGNGEAPGGESTPAQPPPDPVVAEFSPGHAPAPAPKSVTVAPAPAALPPAPASQVPLGGSGEFGP
jgi:RNA polymerase sigma factor (sigma-70 family)